MNHAAAGEPVLTIDELGDSPGSGESQDPKVAASGEGDGSREEAVPTEILVRRAAITLFAERGYAATGIRDIANAVGIKTASLYYYISNKHELLVDIMVVGLESLITSARASLSDVDEPENQLAVLVSGLVAAHAVNRLVGKVIDAEVTALDDDPDARDRVIGLRDEYEQIWADVLASGSEAGVFTIGNERLTRLALLSMCTGMTDWYRPAGEENLKMICRHMVGVALSVVCAQRHQTPVVADDVSIVDLALVPRNPWEPPADDAAASGVMRVVGSVGLGERDADARS